MAVDGAGNLYFADMDNHRVLRVDSSGVITTIAGSGDYSSSRDSSLATQVDIGRPQGVAVDSAGNIYFADRDNHVILAIDSSGALHLAAGSGESGFAGEDGSATEARIESPRGVAVDGTGNLFFADTDNHRIRKVDPAGIITTVAGTGKKRLRWRRRPRHRNPH